MLDIIEAQRGMKVNYEVAPDESQKKYGIHARLNIKSRRKSHEDAQNESKKVGYTCKPVH